MRAELRFNLDIGRQNPCMMATDFANPTGVYTVYENQLAWMYSGTSWTLGSTLFDPPPWYLVVSHDATPTFYVANDRHEGLWISSSGWTGTYSALVFSNIWASNQYTFADPGQLPSLAIDYGSQDFYMAGTSACPTPCTPDEVYHYPASYAGQQYIRQTGNLATTDRTHGVAVDSSSRSVILGTRGVTSASAYGKNAVYRLNNPDVLDPKNHWRPWVDGLPNGTVGLNWLTGQYENGVYYLYAAIYGRGIFKREARGGDF